MHVKRNSYDKFETITAFRLHRNNIRNQPICRILEEITVKELSIYLKTPSSNAMGTQMSALLTWVPAVQ